MNGAPWPARRIERRRRRIVVEFAIALGDGGCACPREHAACALDPCVRGLRRTRGRANDDYLEYTVHFRLNKALPKLREGGAGVNAGIMLSGIWAPRVFPEGVRSRKCYQAEVPSDWDHAGSGVARPERISR
jgi:hypothetical protein